MAERQVGEALKQNLEDAGCSREVKERFLPLYREERWEEALRVLAKHRCLLLAEVHRSQERLDTLDYLIYQLKKEREREK
jgi:hypothetical protein